MLSPFKKKLYLFMGLFMGIVSLSIMSCENSTIEEPDDDVEQSDDQENPTEGENQENVNENEDLSVPEQSDVTQVYLKRALTSLTVGQTINLENYIGILPGTNEDQDDTSFTASILTVADSDDCASLDGNRLTLYRVGAFMLSIETNSSYRVFNLEVQASSTLNTLTSFLGGIGSNYTGEYIAQDDLGAEYVSIRTYRDDRYIYSSSSQGGYILAADDNIYTFTLSDVDSDDLDIEVPPVGDSSDYYATFYDMNAFANQTYWRYGESFSDDAQYSSYNYIMDVSSTYASRFCAALFMATSTTASGYTVYPYQIYARVTSSEIRFVPVYANTSLTVRVYFTTPIRFTNIGTTSVSALKSYVDANIAPEQVDTSEIIENFTALSTSMNYTWYTTMNVYYEDGSKLGTNTNVWTRYFVNTYYHLSYRSIMPGAYWSSNFSGSNGTLIPGGLFNLDNKTYQYNNYLNTENVEDYELVGEYVYSGVSGSYSTWYAYSNMSRYILTTAYSMSNLRNSYPELTADGDYYFYGSNSIHKAIVQGSLAFGVQPYSAVSGTLNTALNSALESSTLIHFDYDANDDLEGVTITTKVKMDSSAYSASYMSEDYTMEFITTIYDIGKTDFSNIINHVSQGL